MVKTNAHVQLFYLLPPRIWVARDQTQPGSFSRERKETGYDVVNGMNFSARLAGESNNYGDMVFKIGCLICSDFRKESFKNFERFFPRTPLGFAWPSWAPKTFCPAKVLNLINSRRHKGGQIDTPQFFLALNFLFHGRLPKALVQLFFVR